MKTYSFEKLDVWQCSRKLTERIYIATKSFPEEEKFGLVSQMRRATISVCSNLAEGSAKYTNKDKARFTAIAFASLMEILNQVIISFDLKFINNEQLLSLRVMIDEIAVKASRLREAQLRVIK